MKKVFILGAYFNTSESDTNAYPLIANIFKKYFKNVEVIVPTDIEEYKNNYKLANPETPDQLVDKAMVDFDLSQIKAADLLFADVTNKSTGVGIELGIAKENNKNIVFCAKKNSKISNMVFGAFPDKTINYYETISDLEKLISNLNF